MPNFTKFSVHPGCGSDLLWRRCNNVLPVLLITPGFPIVGRRLWWQYAPAAASCTSYS